MASLGRKVELGEPLSPSKRKLGEDGISLAGGEVEKRGVGEKCLVLTRGACGERSRHVDEVGDAVLDQLIEELVVLQDVPLATPDLDQVDVLADSVGLDDDADHA
eukprot:CAMPEP_0202438850 /NCGR_PEP_ID=MMETSP1345-20130828/35469_1 /ASSEMBLY_ACC=CAM_ASM_000843 /TAXON_ID=342563 /ORGANISM="Fabrea Fabrea salina" /LENGTH=104 /DNA_ID=CAMNT_0049053317 /DNA_START=319 /DNA_END=633 /DNA_ORIENTATION=-